jgi:uncharacterized repeat protein (TIGR03803 family)
MGRHDDRPRSQTPYRPENTFDDAAGAAEGESALRAFPGPCVDALDEGLIGMGFEDDRGEQRSSSQPGAGALIADKEGTLYGTTHLGGIGDYGTVFKLTPPAKGQTVWTETVLYSFKGGSDGQEPEAGLIADDPLRRHRRQGPLSTLPRCAH